MREENFSDSPLWDSSGRFHDYMRISVTDRCQLRCVYCMPAEGLDWMPKSQILTFEDIERFAMLAVSWGVRKIRLTGGEPLLRQGIVPLVERLAKIPGLESLGLTSNGMRFGHFAKDLKNAGLNKINLSVDTLRPERFLAITRRTGHAKLMYAIEQALRCDFDQVSINSVIQKGVNADEILDLVQLARERKLAVRLIEAMPFADNSWGQERMMSASQMRGVIAEHYKISPVVDSETLYPISQEYTIPGFVGRIGIIASMTESFCAGCTRLRLTADGGLKNCLFAAPTVNLREVLRHGTDEELALLVHETLQQKSSAHRDYETLATMGTERMGAIGG